MRIDLGKYRKPGERVLSGRQNGKTLRNELKIDDLDKKISENIEIFVPEDIYSLNSSYFLGLFGPSVRKLGEEKFKQKYTFICDDIISRNIEDGISRALKDSNVLTED